MTDLGEPEVLVSTGSFPVSESALVAAGRTTILAEGRRTAEISVTLLGDEEMRRLHSEYLGKDAPTDVLVFSLGDEEHPVGDVYIGIEQARRQAEELGVTLEEELVRLVVHGTLHTLGYDHPDGPERLESPMFARQEELVQRVVSALHGA